MLRSFTLALALLALPAHAAVFHVEATGPLDAWAHGGFGLDDPLGLLPFSVPEANGASAVVLSFDYDTTTGDLNPDPRVGIYAGAISNLSFAVDGIPYQGFADSTLVTERGRLLEDASPDGAFSVWIGMSFQDDLVAGRSTSIAMFLHRYHKTGEGPLLTDTLGQLPARSEWGIGAITYQIDDLANEGVVLAEATAWLDDYTVTEVSMPAVPIPSAAFLFSGGLPLLWALRRRRR